MVPAPTVSPPRPTSPPVNYTFFAKPETECCVSFQASGEKALILGSTQPLRRKDCLIIRARRGLAATRLTLSGPGSRCLIFRVSTCLKAWFEVWGHLKILLTLINSDLFLLSRENLPIWRKLLQVGGESDLPAQDGKHRNTDNTIFGVPGFQRLTGLVVIYCFLHLHGFQIPLFFHE